MTAPSEHPLKIDDHGVSSENLIRRLSNRYFLVLAAVAALVTIDQAIVQPLLIRMNSYAPAINMAGRQRMLSQRLTKSALALQAASDETSRQHYRDELLMTLAEWSSAHSALRHGDPRVGLPKLDSPEFNRAWSELEPYFEGMMTAGTALVDHTFDSPPVVISNAASDITRPATMTKTVATILDSEAAYLPIMEHIVSLVEQEADRQVVFLRFVAFTISTTIIVLLMGLGWYVVRPATQVIRGQVERLEMQVASRTRQLALANDSLRHEMAERQQAELNSRRLAAQLTHAARMTTMGHFTAALAHEINQPLATIANFAETCELDLADSITPLSGKLGRQIECIKQSALRAGQIVRRIRNFVRPNSQTPFAQAELNGLIQEVVKLCRFEAQRDEVQITLQLTSENVLVLADPIQIQQVLINLLQNAFQALKASPAAQRRLQICTTVEDDNVLVAVSDSGPGFELDPDTLFMPFSTTKTDGLGIGLSICRSIIERHHGQIWADTTLSSGAMICFSLPLIQEHNASLSKRADCICR